MTSQGARCGASRILEREYASVHHRGSNQKSVIGYQEAWMNERARFEERSGEKV